ncbi:MAG: hypothetical protein DIU82_04165 [Bacillota bacterium]|nr:MAG: hypothetical protein DIU82_04165 [Bacillota bacterium]
MIDIPRNSLKVGSLLPGGGSILPGVPARGLGPHYEGLRREHTVLSCGGNGGRRALIQICTLSQLTRARTRQARRWARRGGSAAGRRVVGPVHDVLEELAGLEQTGKRAVMATVVHVVGSAYRREAARMLVDEDGRACGAISGGCLESEVREAALEVLRSGQPRLMHFDMSADDDLVWGLGLGCNGRIDVFLEPVDRGYLNRVRRAREEGRRLAAAVVVSAGGGSIPAGSRLYVGEDGIEGTLGEAWLDRQVAADARELMSRGESRSYLYRLENGVPVVERDRQTLLARRDEPGQVQVFLETIAPPPVLLLFGAGHDAVPLTEVAAQAGFRVVVVDSRPAFAQSHRFPRAHRVICAYPEEVPAHVTVDADTYVVVMTHNFHHDTAILRAIWGQAYRYLGILGPWERTEKILGVLRAEGFPVDEHLDRLYAPVGLDIGAEGPEQIAVAIVAELLAVRRGANAGFLRFRRGPLHEIHRAGQPAPWAALAEDSPYPGVRRRRFDGGQFTAVRYEFAPGARFPLHHHPEEQLVIVETGDLILQNGDETARLRAGDAAWTPSGVPHGITAGPAGAAFVNIVVPRRQHDIRVVGEAGGERRAASRELPQQAVRGEPAQ